MTIHDSVPLQDSCKDRAKPRVLIVAEHASALFGGEAALPLHYFRVLERRGIDVWLVTHSRTRDELMKLYPGEERIHFVEDTWFHKQMWQIGLRLPAQIAYFTTGFVSRFAGQFEQRRIVKRLVASEGIDVIHQPIPVSPREPSMIYGFGIPVVIGPMNGGMEYPPNFKQRRNIAEQVTLALGRWSAGALNNLMPGKRKAAQLLVANERTRHALPTGISANVVELVENGIDLTLWRPTVNGTGDAFRTTPMTFIFLGRLVEWKGVELLLEAFKAASERAPMQLLIVGDGKERTRLMELAAQLQILGKQGEVNGKVAFTGWLPQQVCAARLQSADCLVLPSLLECGGAVVLEAMSMGKPVIATAWGGPMDYLDESCGILVPPTDRASLVAGLRTAMVRLADNPQERNAMGERGRCKVLRDYDWEVKVDRILEIYASVQKPHQQKSNSD